MLAPVGHLTLHVSFLPAIFITAWRNTVRIRALLIVMLLVIVLLLLLLFMVMLCSHHLLAVLLIVLAAIVLELLLLLLHHLLLGHFLALVHLLLFARSLVLHLVVVSDARNHLCTFGRVLLLLLTFLVHGDTTFATLELLATAILELLLLLKLLLLIFFVIHNTCKL